MTFPLPPQSTVAVAASAVSVPQRAAWTTFKVLMAHTGGLTAIEIDRGNTFFATASADHTIKLFDLATCKSLAAIDAHTAAPRCLASSSLSPYLFSAGDDRDIRCIDLTTLQVVRRFYGHSSAVLGLAVSPDHDIVVSCARDTSVRVWDIRSQNDVMLFAGHRDAVRCVAVQSAAPHVLTGSEDRTAALWDLRNGQRAAVVTRHSRMVMAVSFSPPTCPDWSFLTAGRDGIRRWPVRQPMSQLAHVTHRGATGQTFGGASGGASAGPALHALSYGDDGTVVSGGDQGSLCFWKPDPSGPGILYCGNVVLARAPGSIESERDCTCVAFDRSATRCLVGMADKTVRLLKPTCEQTQVDPVPLPLKAT